MKAWIWGWILLALPVAAESVKPFNTREKTDAVNALGQVMQRFGYFNLDGNIDQEYHINTWYYPIQVNGTKIEFCLDTGCDITCLPPHLAQKAGIVFEGDVTNKIYAAFSAKEVKQRIGVAEKFLFGPLLIKGARIQVFQSALSQGLLGMDFLMSNNTLLDVRAARIYVAGKGRKSEVNTLLRQQGYTRIPLQLSSNLILGVPVEIKKAKGIMIVDTGAFATTVTSHFGKKAGLLRDQAKLGTRDVHGTEAGLNLTRTERFNVGPYDASFTNFTVSDSKFKPMERDDIAGFLGIDFLYKNNAVIDLETRQMYLRP